ncbi:MAG: DEAD/DEAH box helicase [Candidatus Nanoarchaeia archaeon]
MELKNFKPRLYQESIFNTCKGKNCLVILGTGLGKTAIAMMLAAYRLDLYPGSKILMIAPTRPLVAQHYETFKKHLAIDPNKIVFFTGHVKPEDRAELWKNASLIFSTPQSISNDIVSNRISLQDVSALIIDEIQHCVGDYDYVWICKQYDKVAKFPRIIGLTASPGSDVDKIMEVCKNAFIEDVEIRTEEDPDVKPYIKEVDIDYVLVDLPEDFKVVQKYFNDCLKLKMQKLKDYGVFTSVSNLSKKDLLSMQKDLQRKIISGDRDFMLRNAVSVLAEVMKVHHALELLETQGISSLFSYMRNLFESANKTKVKAVKRLVKDPNFKSAYVKTQIMFEASLEHPKLDVLKSIISSEVNKNPNVKIIVFNHYRDSVARLVDILNRIEGVKAKLFVGQTKKDGTGLSQKEQLKILDEFKQGAYNVVCMTSVGEEGLDIVAVDLVIFFEPVPSAIRSIQRRGRTGRQSSGHVVVLVTKNTRDEAYRWTAHHKEKRMHRIIANLKKKLQLQSDKQPTLASFIGAKESAFKVLVDSREKSSNVVKELVNLGVDVSMQNLPVGDYVISDRIGIELKTKEDFVNSLIDKRLLAQIKELRNNFESPLLIIEGEEDIYAIRKVHPNAIRGMLSSIAIDYNVPIIYTKNPKDTAEFIHTIARREQEGKEKEFPLRLERKPLTTKEQQEYIVESLPGVGPSLAKSLLNKFGSVSNVFNASKDELQEVNNLGPKKADDIRRVVDESYEKS